jgi:Flp pilus assembly pilin Flp
MRLQLRSRYSRGQTLAEYTILMALIGLVLVIGEDSPLELVFRAVQGYYGRFTFSLAMP